MLEGLKKFIENLKKFSAPKEVEKEVRVEVQEIVKMVQRQLALGVDGNSNKVYLIRYGIEHYDYAPRTIRNKSQIGGLGSFTDHITNYMSGRFYNSLFVEVYNGGSFEVMSNSPLIEIIKERSGPDIIKLSRESEQYLFEHQIAPDLQETIDELFYEM